VCVCVCVSVSVIMCVCVCMSVNVCVHLSIHLIMRVYVYVYVCVSVYLLAGRSPPYSQIRPIERGDRIKNCERETVKIEIEQDREKCYQSTLDLYNCDIS
jgi:hypothetical protein